MVRGVPCLPPIRRIVVVASGKVSVLTRVFLRICKCKRDDYAVWEACQEHMCCLFQKILPSIHCFSWGDVLEGAVTLHQVVASNYGTSHDNLRRILSDDLFHVVSLTLLIMERIASAVFFRRNAWRSISAAG